MRDMSLLELKSFTYEDLHKITGGKKIVIFGSPLNIEEVLGYEGLANINISYIVDNDKKKSGTKVKGYTIYTPSHLESEDKENILILVAINFVHMRGVMTQLEQMGIYDIYSIVSMEARKNERLGIKKQVNVLDILDDENHTDPEVRMFFTKDLSGYGVEFGAGPRPFPVPDSCEVAYADCFSHNGEEFYTSWFSEKFEVPITYRTSIDKMEGIEDNSLDFILSSHVIEHSPNPFSAFEKGYKKLKKGGKMVFIVPNMLAFADRARALTTVEHLDLDYREPCRERDFAHYAEKFIKYGQTPLDSLYETIKKAYDENADLHYHTFTYESFGEAVNYFCDKYYRFSEVVGYKPLKLFRGLEFFYVMMK